MHKTKSMTFCDLMRSKKNETQIERIKTSLLFSAVTAILSVHTDTILLKHKSLCFI